MIGNTARSGEGPALAGSVEEILHRAGAVPAATSFPGVDELIARFDAIAAAHPGSIERRRIGTSRRGEPIPMYSVGSGRRNHLVVGGVHPNEPIGALTALHLAQALADRDPFLEALDARWHIVPCIDPDGARLNEAWFSEPGDRRHYGRHFYRPAPTQQVEWSFPTDYKRAYFDEVTSESQALMRVIDRVQPDLYVALHNGEMGGVYYYLSRPVPALHEVLHAIPAGLGLPLDTGEPEAPHLESFAPAIFGMGTIGETYDYYEALGVDPVSVVGGSSSSEYASRYGTLSLIAELPYWTHPDSDDVSPIDETYAHLLRRTAHGMRELHSSLASILERAEPHLVLETPFLEATRAFVPMFASAAEADEARAQDAAAARPATVAERFGCEDILQCFRLRYGGMLLRALEAETSAGTAGPELHRLAAETAELYREWQSRPSIADDASVVPLALLVGVQYGATLAAAVAVRDSGA
ncbi:M14 family zinc carboxypeptidase [Agromyces albus]|uniref:Peptidase M14 n=1 Tax=Agromyces albus TaxID=205332 RepID=A0A4Q2L0R0_9MICO|nr:M14 family zinc carboxypeptidase [Agromyces albus]RXZ70440.1 peptidase M14 [Agromyces albus]